MKILITGAAGHLGTALVRRLSAAHTLVAMAAADLDVSDAASVSRAIRVVGPDAVVNCAAFTDVDAAEDQPLAALRVNALALRTLATAAAEGGAALVHYSTDFVFDGRANRPYLETDSPNPRSTYACSKLVGEWFAAEARRHYVLRVESLFGDAGPAAGRRTSIDRIVDAIEAGEEVRVFVDRVITPSYTADVADATKALLEGGKPPGVYHCVNSGSCSFMELAAEVARQMGRRARLLPVKMTELELRAERPLYCALSNERLAGVGVEMPAWQDALARCLADRRRSA